MGVKENNQMRCYIRNPESGATESRVIDLDVPMGNNSVRHKHIDH
jgi:hypothetical protein